MNLEIGQYIHDGESELLVCEIKEYENKLYIYLLDEEKDEAYFYEMKRVGDGWEFNRETNAGQIQQLIIHFSNIKDIIKGE